MIKKFASRISFQVSPTHSKPVEWFKIKEGWMIIDHRYRNYGPMSFEDAEKFTEELLSKENVPWDDKEATDWLASIEEPTHHDFPYYMDVYEAILSKNPKAYDIYRGGDTFCREGVTERMLARILEISGLEIKE
jgi:hypothetical protein